ncbi:glutathione S-transferase [Pantoea sp. Acro-805]|uniref:Glutathione S-transferase n=1 Tax=Candidatus Pantoea formicae TaxID=2608355 RepID=A0ABX0R6M4_9GAMM|nr:glutathione S-transferase [Pantoea formicae]MDF7648713.1 glutathione S-transferase [Erwiniaceae bacterium L1_54_3]NIF03668.1 glutathione S-transferase [Pantoea formicae]
MKLIGMLDSPYVRRVAISLAMYGKAFEHQPLSVFGDYARFADINPAVKAPTLVLDDGTVLMDSSLMLHYLEATVQDGNKLLPSNASGLAQDTRLLSLALAASEKAVQHVYEHRLRPEDKWHQPWVDRVTQQLLADCTLWNVALEGREAKRDQVAITSAVVWSFIQLMVPHVVHANDFPNLQAHAQRMEAMPEFIDYPMH